jgi:predicted transcriptional regulator of viral defense system
MNVRIDHLEPIVDSLRMRELLRDTIDKRGKIARMIESGELIQLRRGLYATRDDLDPLALAASIYGPSYISFETALSYHGLIPEEVYEITSATLRRPKEFENRFGRYRFRRVPERVYPIGVERVADSQIPFLIASPTKALCDRIALEPRMRSMRDVHRWAELMRLDPAMELDVAVLAASAEHYRRPAVRLLRRAAEQNRRFLA